MMIEMKRKNVILLAIAFVALWTMEVKQAHALTKAEVDCGVRSTYYEARSLSKTAWDKVLKVAVNRKQNPKKYGSKSSNLCDIVHSRQYSTRHNKRIKEPKTLALIAERIGKGYWKNAGNYAFFRSRRGKMFFRV